jgi:hypothetical protein
MTIIKEIKRRIFAFRPSVIATLKSLIPEKREIGQPNAKFGKKTDSVSSSATSGW